MGLSKLRMGELSIFMPRLCRERGSNPFLQISPFILRLWRAQKVLGWWELCQWLYRTCGTGRAYSNTKVRIAGILEFTEETAYGEVLSSKGNRCITELSKPLHNLDSYLAGLFHQFYEDFSVSIGLIARGPWSPISWRCSNSRPERANWSKRIMRPDRHLAG